MDLLALLLKDVLPATLNAIKAHHAQVHPDLPPLTDAEAVALLRTALDTTEAKDDAIIAAHGGAPVSPSGRPTSEPPAIAGAPTATGTGGGSGAAGSRTIEGDPHR